MMQQSDNNQAVGGHSKRIAVVGSLTQAMLNFRSDLISELVSAGHEVYAFATDYSEHSLRAVRELGAIPVPYQLNRFSYNPFSDLLTTWQLYRLFKQLRIDISFCYFVKPVIFGTLAAWLAKVPFRVAKIEGLGRAFIEPPQGAGLRCRFVRRVQVGLYRFVLPKTHQVFLLNPDDYQDLIHQYRIAIPRLTVLSGIGTCLHRYPYHPPQLKPIRFIFVGRLLQEKGIRYFLQAAKEVKAKHPEVEFLVVGEPDTAKGSISRQELDDCVTSGLIVYPGLVTNVVDWLAQSSVFVLPSYYREGVPRSSQEAMAVGLPVITTDMPGCRETVEPGKNGFLIPPHDVGALVKQMLYFIDHPQQIDGMGRYSRQLAEQKFDVVKINKQIMDALDLTNTSTAGPTEVNSI
ncbi:glycosyltransferase family 4 protein [Alkalimonas amylolytica]|uniref:Glycosyltransferase involved in cell wall bisynthesis n=1 Tax=Alkalimonas amylolytica TaxID=152573 RepID=A0A1H4A268_ALKAM|nr:glycosyltransferase family 4 protein [Alkalimonas amylolytica]SEA30243.1 Glycosyltransferase involved in cell wall bisynthesis [Alkalimonas amylolytica]